MGYSCCLYAISDGIPREAIWTQPEAGPERANQFVQYYFKGKFVLADEDSINHVGCRGPELYCGSWGNTVLFSGDIDTLDVDYDMPEGFGLWYLQLESVVDYVNFRVEGGPYGPRDFEIDCETTWLEGVDWPGFSPRREDNRRLPVGKNKGKPLEFELSYLRGEHALPPEEEYPLPFHPGEYGAAASIWAFGIEGETPTGDAVMTPLIEQCRAATEHVKVHRFEYRG